AAAARALYCISDESDVPMLKQMLQDKDPFVRFVAAIALSYIGSIEALPVLKKMLAKTPAYNRPGIERAIRRVNIWNSPQRNKELEAAIFSEDKELACWAIQKIAQLGLKEALPTLMKALEKVRPAHGADRLRMEVEILSAIKKLGGKLSPEEIKKLEEFPPETLW
ncbi:MAG: HEAT repeat domain-containing protein, partial [Armatimonadetes bacterium]|nr:HEAT repeat domain-containing protein [Armatimonadota bacterium]